MQYLVGRKLPDWVQEEFPLARAISIGGCGCGSPAYSQLVAAHAQPNRDVDRSCPGTICFMDATAWDDGYPSGTFLHEYAHLKAGIRYGRTGRRQMHDQVWKDTLQFLLNEWGYEYQVRYAYDPLPHKLRMA